MLDSGRLSDERECLCSTVLDSAVTRQMKCYRLKTLRAYVKFNLEKLNLSEYFHEHGRALPNLVLWAPESVMKLI